MFSSDRQAIHVFDCAPDGSLSNARHFHTISPGCADGIRVDSDGNLWSSAADGVHCIAPDGQLMGKILLPELVSNLCFGGSAKHELYVTATTSIYKITLNRKGVQFP
jgi:gluconolactonase